VNEYQSVKLLHEVKDSPRFIRRFFPLKPPIQRYTMNTLTNYAMVVWGLLDLRLLTILIIVVFAAALRQDIFTMSSLQPNDPSLLDLPRGDQPMCRAWQSRRSKAIRLALGQAGVLKRFYLSVHL
jgi:hypothetical protein